MVFFKEVGFAFRIRGWEESEMFPLAQAFPDFEGEFEVVKKIHAFNA